MRSCLVAALVIVALGQGALAHAQDDAALQARALFDQGRVAAESEHWIEALDLYTRSRALLERPATVFNVAAVLVRLGRARESILTIDRYLELSDPERDAAARTDAEELRAAAEASLRHVALRVAPADATVEIDGATLEGTGAERSAVLDPGAHVVAVSHEGYATRHLTLESGHDRADVTLVALDGTLVVASTVDDATIAIDDTDAGVGHAERSVAPGTHRVVLRAEGYAELTREVSVSPGERVQVDAALELLPHEQGVLESPVFWGLAGAGAVVLIVLAVGLGVGLSPERTEATYGGNTGVVLMPLVSF